MSLRLTSAISASCLRVTLPTLVDCGTDEPLSIPAAFLIRKPLGGLFSSNLNEPSLKMVISAGMISPIRLEVRALYSLQNAIRLMPCCASAGPIGGAGLALPALICRVTIALTFLAIVLLHVVLAGATAHPPTNENKRLAFSG